MYLSSTTDAHLHKIVSAEGPAYCRDLCVGGSLERDSREQEWVEEGAKQLEDKPQQAR